MAFRALGSVLSRQAYHSAFRSAVPRPAAIASGLRLQACQPIWRSFAADAGFLDKEDVTDRVLEVVRKFDKVGYSTHGC